MIFKQRLFTVLLGLLFATVLTDQASALYDPGVGRFCSRDPVGYNSGTLGLYELCSSTPLSYMDPWGLFMAPPDGMISHIPPPCLPLSMWSVTYTPIAWSPATDPILYGTFRHIAARNELFHRLIDTCVDCSHCGTKTPKIWGKKPKECTEGRCQEQALAIAESIFNTLERNRRWLWFPGQRYRGFWCYEWATGFEKALDNILDFETSCFYFDMWHSRRPSENKKDVFDVHHFLRIKSRCSDAEVWIDDGFTESGKLVHIDPPAPYGPPQPGGGGDDPYSPGVIPQPPGGVDW